MHTINAAAAGQFAIGGDLLINRMGYGAMRITGPGIWGEPRDRAEALRTLQGLPELGVNFIDTADSYGPEVSEHLICEALHPYYDMVIATKGGLTRQGPDLWSPVGRPEYLRQCVMLSLRRLRRERLDLWQLHRIDPHVPRDEQFEVIQQMRQEGFIRHVGLSEVSIKEIQAAQAFFPVATVQNVYNLIDRQHEEVLEYCTQQHIGFIPWFPLAAGTLAASGAVLDTMARKYDATINQVALAWLLKRSPVMLPIPGTSKVQHLQENVAAAHIALSDADIQELDAQSRGTGAR